MTLQITALRAPGVRLPALRLEAGECVAVLGPSGAGKSLLLRAIADLDPCDGDIRLDGQSWRDLSGPQWRRRVGLVPAEPGWWSEHVLDHFDDEARARELIASMNLDAQCLDTPVSRLSTGERARLALARALIRDPEVLLLDEPTAALDADSHQAVEGVLRRCLDEGLSIVMVTHDPAFAARLGRRVLRLRDGEAHEDVPS